MNSYENHVIVPADHFKKRVRQQYNDISMAIAREAVQNAVDAGASRIEFSVSPDRNRLTISDNGHGMTAGEFEKVCKCRCKVVKTTKVCSVHVKESLDRHLKEVRRLSALIETELQKYESLSRANYAHVGDIVYVEERMTETLEFLTETEYIPLEE